KDGKTALDLAAEKKYVEAVKYLLKAEASADKDFNEKDFNHIYFAARKNYVNVVKLLLEKETDINLRLLHTAGKEDIQIIKLLLENGEKNFDIIDGNVLNNMDDKKIYNITHEDVCSNALNCIELLNPDIIISSNEKVWNGTECTTISDFVSVRATIFQGMSSIARAKENVQAILSVLPHAIDLVRGETGENVHAQLRVGSHECRQRKSPYPMINVAEALNIVAEHSNILPPVNVPVDKNLIGMVLAEDVVARQPVPGYRASILDGYAVVASDGPGVYPVIGVSIANTSHLSTDKLQPGQIARITTGAPVPSGATAVVMVEDTTLIRASADGLQEESVEIHVRVNDGDNIREIGSDTSFGAIVARKGELLSAVGGEIGVLASVGVKE
ncbi:6330_t:CDS:2, partial [Scutellospora calospora]